MPRKMIQLAGTCTQKADVLTTSNIVPRTLELLVGDLLETDNDVLAVRVTSQLRNVLLHVTHDGRTLTLVADINDLLHDIIGIGIAHHGLQHAVTGLGIHGTVQVEGDVDDGPDHLVAIALVGVLETLLNNVRGELVLGEIQQVRLDLLDEDSTISLQTVLHHELDHVVAIAVAHQLAAARAQLLEDN
jgi:hypothetical protein